MVYFTVRGPRGLALALLEQLAQRCPGAGGTAARRRRASAVTECRDHVEPAVAARALAAALRVQAASRGSRTFQARLNAGGGAAVVLTQK